jgi:hypothetical protein
MEDFDIDPNEHHLRIADRILGEGDYFSGPVPAPHPAEAGAPPDCYAADEYVPGDNDAELLPDDLDPEAMRKVDPAAIALCAIEPQNDYGNGQRLLHHFKAELLNVREVGYLTSTAVMTGRDLTWDMAFLPDGTMFFTEKCGGLSVRLPDGKGQCAARH